MSNKIKGVILLLLSLIPLAMLLIMYKNLPDTIPLRFNDMGAASEYSSKSDLFLLAMLPIIIGIIMFFIGKRHQNKANAKAYSTVGFAVVGMFVLEFAMMLALTMGNYKRLDEFKLFSLDFFGLTTIIFSLLFIVLGNVLPKTQRNRYLGVRLPWTMKNDEVWAKTHRLSGRLFIAIGILGIILAFLLKGTIAFISVISFMFLLLIFTTIYAKQLYDKVA